MTMLLSEAIRLGSMLHPQCFGHTWEHGGDDGMGVITASCALGAASVAAMPASAHTFRGSLAYHPSCFTSLRWPYVTGELMTTIINMNDCEHQSREAIADYVAEWEIAHGVVSNRYTVLEGVTA